MSDMQQKIQRVSECTSLYGGIDKYTITGIHDADHRIRWETRFPVHVLGWRSPWEAPTLNATISSTISRRQSIL